MTECYQTSQILPRVQRREVEVNFEGGAVTTDGGSQLLRLVDRRLGLTEILARLLEDHRARERCAHPLVSLLRQRIYGLALGYEDLNDHGQLRGDIAFQTAVGRDQPLASAATLCRLEKQADRTTAIRMHQILVDQFIQQHARPPKRLILDLDATDAVVHGMQEGRHFSGYYDNYCYLPLYVFCGHHVLVSYLRPASCGAAHHATPVLHLLVKRLRQAWPKVRIIIRADSGFSVPRLLAWCDRQGVDYIIGIAKNSRLLASANIACTLAKVRHALDGGTHRVFSEFNYASGSWRRDRRIIVKAEHGVQGSNPRFVVTSLPHSARHLYVRLYCARGEMENRIKEQKCLFSERVSCQRWWPNQFRILLSAFAYLLVNALRQIALKGTAYAKTQVDTVRLRLFKIGGVVLRNSRRVKLMLSSQYPERDRHVFINAINILLRE